MSKEISACRPDSQHWCVECCQKREHGEPCLNLGPLPDGTKGCLGYKGQNLGGFPTGCSETLDCLAKELADEGTRKKFIQAVSKLPPGEIKLGEVIKKMVDFV